MIKWIEATGKNEEAAISAALERLGLERDDVSVELLERAKKGILGFGSAPAKVRVSYEAPDEAPPKAAPPVRQETEKPVSPPRKAPAKPAPPVEAPPRPVAHPETPPRPASPAPPDGVVPAQPPAGKPPAPPKVPAAEPVATGAEEKGPELESKIEEFLTGLLDRMDVTATPNITRRPEGGYQVVLEGEKLGGLIGHRGETLDAIQQLVNYAVNRGRTRRVRVHIDVENYRAKREESLRHLAEKVAAKVVKYRRNVTLEPMNAYERHVIHEALQEYPDVVTYSTGSEPNRRTVVAYSKGKHPY